MTRPKSLQQRLSLFLFLPVALLLIGMGVASFVYARNSLLAQWKEASILKLQRAAHNVDMRLSHIKEWIRVFNETAGEEYSDLINTWIVSQLKELRGATRVNLTWENEQPDQAMPSDSLPKMRNMGGRRQMMAGGRRMHMRPFHGARIRKITPPRYDSLIEHETVSLISELNDESGQTIGRLEVVLDFDYLIENVVASGWWQSHKAFLVNDAGKILAGTVPEKRESFADSKDALEQKTLQAMKTMPFGTVRGQGHPPSEVSGFYKLQEAPWSLVMIAPGKDILAPVVRLRSYYFMIGTGFIVLILLLIRLVTGGTVSSIREISRAADRVARGDYGDPLPVKTRDEVGELTRSFNTMVLQLEERIRLKEALDVAMEVQQNLLPTEMPQVKGLDIAGESIYCDETGGDLYDFLEVRCRNSDQLGIAVGDVSGHGISAALLMATVRAFLRCRVTQPGGIAEIISDVNRLAAYDTRETCQFMTLFYAEIDPAKKTMSWVRAGHDPAIFYDPAIDRFNQLEGEGVALGIDGEIKYQENVKTELSRGQIIVIGTDGLWETQNKSGEMFGKKRLKVLIREHAQSSAKEILSSIMDSLKTFQGSEKQEDDVTLVVAKVSES
jgi:sigma-B regulation protein RsbU (phosphoserine phosphatase)